MNGVQNLKLYFVFTTFTLLHRAIIDDSYDDVTLVVMTGTQCCCKAEWRLCLLWMNCCHVCGLNDRPAFILMPHLDDRSPRKRRSSLQRLVSLPRPETCCKIQTYKVLMSLYIYVWFARVQLLPSQFGLYLWGALNSPLVLNSVSTERPSRGRLKLEP